MRIVKSRTLRTAGGSGKAWGTGPIFGVSSRLMTPDGNRVTEAIFLGGEPQNWDLPSKGVAFDQHEQN